MMTMKMIKKAITLTLGLVMMGAATFAQSLADAKKAIDAEQYQKATSMLKTLTSSNAKEGQNYFYLGNVYLKTDDIDSARLVYTNGTTAEPKNALNFVGLGHADLLANNPTSAKTNFDKALSLGAKNYETYLYIGRAYLDQPKPDFAAALPNLQKADELDAKDKDPETFMALADYYALQTGKNTEAYQNYLRVTDINPNSTRAIVQIGKMYKMAFSFPDAEAQIQKAIAIDPNYGPAYRELSENEMQWSRADPATAEAKRTEALANYRKYLDLTDKSFDSRIRYAQFLVYANDFVTLEKELATLNAEPTNPKMFLVTRLRGHSAVENKNFQQGVKYMEELFARKQDAARILDKDYLYLGKAYLGMNNDSLAAINIAKAVELDSNNAQELAAVGLKYFTNRNWVKAAQLYKTVIDANAKNPQRGTNYFYYGTANYAAANGTDKVRLADADGAFVALLELAPETEGAVLYRAKIAKALDAIDNKEVQKGLAIPFYEQYVKMVTVDKPEKATAPATVRGLVEAYNYMGYIASGTDKEKAKEYFGKTLAIDPANAYAADNLKVLNAPAPAKKAPIKK